jgi:hypothetical protein
MALMKELLLIQAKKKLLHILDVAIITVATIILNHLYKLINFLIQIWIV